MFKRFSKFPSLISAGIGVVLGIVAANVDFSTLTRASDSQRPNTEPSLSGPAEKSPACYSQATAKETLLALAEPRATALGNAQAVAGKKPNILVIWGDDIGIHNISAYNHGIMGYRTPNIDRLGKEGANVHRLLRPAKLHGRTRLVHSGSASFPHRPVDHRHARFAARHSRLDAYNCRPLEAARLRHWPVRQESSGRQQQALADRARLRRVLRQSLSSERRGRTGRLLLSQGSRIQEKVWTARRPSLLRHRCGRPDG